MQNQNFISPGVLPAGRRRYNQVLKGQDACFQDISTANREKHSLFQRMLDIIRQQSAANGRICHHHPVFHRKNSRIGVCCAYRFVCHRVDPLIRSSLPRIMESHTTRPGNQAVLSAQALIFTMLSVYHITLPDSSVRIHSRTSRIRRRLRTDQ